jgi:hypothetical protein
MCRGDFIVKPGSRSRASAATDGEEPLLLARLMVVTLVLEVALLAVVVPGVASKAPYRAPCPGARDVCEPDG